MNVFGLRTVSDIMWLRTCWRNIGIAAMTENLTAIVTGGVPFPASSSLAAGKALGNPGTAERSPVWLVWVGRNGKTQNRHLPSLANSMKPNQERVPQWKTSSWRRTIRLLVQGPPLRHTSLPRSCWPIRILRAYPSQLC